jgi:putative PIN family toxin of toxin-antitoxin system
MRIVIDTGVLVSRIILPQSIPGQVVTRVIETHSILMSEEMFAELADVIQRPKFLRYYDEADFKIFVHELHEIAEYIPVTTVIEACADPKDNKVLELAVSGQANIIVTSDRHLLVMHPFRSIDILTPKAFLDRI